MPDSRSDAKPLPGPVPVRSLKRVFDLGLSLVLLFFLFPLLAALAVALWLEHRLSRGGSGPIFYLERRISHGREFQIIKFRVIKQAAIEAYRAAKGAGNMSVKIIEYDPKNFTFLGRYVNKLYFDELPQLVNILLGEMTFVGPRPWPVSEWKNSLKEGIDTKGVVPCGLTGLTQSYK